MTTVKMQRPSGGCQNCGGAKLGFSADDGSDQSKIWLLGLSVLGAEFPLFQFGRKGRNQVLEDTEEMQMLSSTFDIIWRAYSIDLADYLKLDKEKQFQMTLNDLKRWNHATDANASPAPPTQ